jgi:hypothetical protein
MDRLNVHLGGAASRSAARSVGSVCWVLVVAHTTRIVPHYYCVLLLYSVFWISARNQNVRQARQIDVFSPLLPCGSRLGPNQNDSLSDVFAFGSLLQ